jgi:competence CoiA-like predicted nuclease
MLVAKNALTNETVHSFKGDIEKLKKLSKDKILVCQECNSPVILKSGKVKIAHFAHKNCECTYTYWENESADHMRAKIDIKERLEVLYPTSSVYIEYKVEETNHRSDIMVVHPDGSKWAFEVQLSRIPVKELLERRTLYQKAGVVDFWLMGYDYNKSTDFSVWKDIRGYSTNLNRITVNEAILINSIPINNILIMKLGKEYWIYNTEVLNAAKDSYFEAKKTLFIILKKKYYNATISMDTQIENNNEVADILLTSKNGTKFAINFIYKNYHDLFKSQSGHSEIFIREVFYKNANINVFWISGVYFVNSQEYYLNRDYGFKYFITKDKDSFIIEAYYTNYYQHKFPAENIIINKVGKVSTFMLEDEKLISNLKLYKDKGYITYNKKCPDCNKTLLLKRQYNNPIYYCNCGYEQDVDVLNCPDCRYRMKLKYSKANIRHYWQCTNYPECLADIDVRIGHK